MVYKSNYRSNYYKTTIDKEGYFIIAGISIILIGLVSLFTWMFTSSTEECDVVDSYWTHITRVERYQIVTREGFDVQPGAFNVLPLGMRFHHTETETYYDYLDNKWHMRTKDVDMPYYRWNIWDWNFNRNVSETRRDFKTKKPIAERTQLDIIIDRLGSGFDYILDFDYTRISKDGYYDKLENVRLKNYSSSKLLRAFDIKIGSVKDYCAYRLLFGIKQEDFECYGRSSYYGDEPAAHLNSDIIEKFEKLRSLNDTEAIEYILTQEYGYILPFLEKCNWVIESNVCWESIHMPENNLYQKLDRCKIDEYKELFKNEQFIPTCLCIPDLYGEYRLIDGRHRYIAAKELNLGMMVIVGSKDK